MKNKEIIKKEDEYGNVTFGEATKLLIDIIGQNVILDLMPKDEHDGFKKKLRDMYKGQAVYNQLGTAEPESPQWYVEQIFLKIDTNYNIPKIAMICIDSFTWQFFYALRQHNPFEKLKKETALFLAKKQLFNFVYYNLIRGEPLSDNSIYKVSGDVIIHFLTDSYEKIFSDITSKYKNNETFYQEVNGYCIKPENQKKYSKLQKKELADYKNNIINWRNEKTYNPNWFTLKPVLDFLMYEKNNEKHVHRLIGLYLRKKTHKAIEEVLHISEEEQNKIEMDIVTMIIANREPEEFYDENDFEFIEQINLIHICLAYQHQENFDIEIYKNIIKAIEEKCVNSKIFFSTWLKARAKVFETGKKLKEECNEKIKKDIINGYKKAYNEGVAYAGCYLSQFLLEAIVVSKYFRRESNNYYGYGYALELFESDKDKLYNFIKQLKNTYIVNDFIDIHYSKNIREKKRQSQISQYYPDFNYNGELINEAILQNNKGLVFKETNDLISAEDSFSKAILLNPLYVNAYSNRGYVYYKMGKDFIKYALIDFNMALTLDPKHEVTLFYRGSILLENAQFEKAIVDFTNLIMINPRDYESYLKRGICYKYMGKFDFAIEDYSRAIEINPQYTEAYNNRAVIYKIIGDEDKAQKDRTKVNQIDSFFFLKHGTQFFI